MLLARGAMNDKGKSQTGVNWEAENSTLSRSLAVKNSERGH